jgi:hypothetical protein
MTPAPVGGRRIGLSHSPAYPNRAHSARRDRPTLADEPFSFLSLYP